MTLELHSIDAVIDAILSPPLSFKVASFLSLLTLWSAAQLLAGQDRPYHGAYNQPISSSAGVCSASSLNYSPMSQPCASDFEKLGFWSPDTA